MWSAEQHAKGARKLEASGHESEARSEWAQAAAKAENIVLRHPKSRWADDALVLQAEGLARSGACEDAQEPIARARKSITAVSLLERLDLADAQCVLAVRPGEVSGKLARVLQSKDEGRRSRAELLAGQAAAMQLDYASAVQLFQRSHEPAALPARANALLELGRAEDAAAAFAALGDSPLYETERGEILNRLAAVATPEMATRALDRLLRKTRMPLAEQARLLLADGDRYLTRGDRISARRRYVRAMAVAPAGTAEAGTAHVRLQQVLIAGARQRSDLVPVVEELTALSREEGGNPVAKSLLDLVRRVSIVPETQGARFRLAELARDSLQAPVLAGQLFLDIAAADTASIYAPKALVAALPLLPERRDSIVSILDGRYATSPYTRAFHGEQSVAYVVVEDSLARELGVEVAQNSSAATGPRPRWDAPVPGPRGPLLDEPDLATASVRVQPRPAVRTPNARDRRAVAQPERP
jgi:tetratricopeptide (TPR) repeat protein